MSTSLMIKLLDRATNGNELLSILDSFVEQDPAAQRMELMSEMLDKMKSAQPTLNPIEF